MRRVICKSIGETVPQFVARLPPSGTTVDACDWIGVDKTREGEWVEEDIGFTVRDTFTKFCSADRMAEDDERVEKQITMESLCRRVFERHGAVQAKWVFQIDRCDVDQLWGELCENLYDDWFEDRIQVSAADPANAQHAVAVHTSDFSNMKQQEKLVRSIRNAGVEERLMLKPVAATQLQLYPDEPPWNSRATSLYVVLPQQVTILPYKTFRKRRNVRSEMAGTRLSEAL
eukprot:TRINITY_DN27264_c0_g1_i1.p1 TRINITY_DN27264_c0_g1~~TRINITY_DN27264_c0_g1_i1.p1  ORF type:complete len:230 (+),score=80.44 TRINITY_DN27264_c0_g1_i1:90-779(+)